MPLSKFSHKWHRVNTKYDVNNSIFISCIVNIRDTLYPVRQNIYGHGRKTKYQIQDVIRKTVY